MASSDQQDSAIRQPYGRTNALAKQLRELIAPAIAADLGRFVGVAIGKKLVIDLHDEGSFRADVHLRKKLTKAERERVASAIIDAVITELIQARSASIKKT